MQMSMVCTSSRCCLDGLVMCTGRAFCVDCVRNEADCCVVATVLMCPPVAQVRLARSERHTRSGAECTACQQYFWSAWMRSGVSGIRSAL